MKKIWWAGLAVTPFLLLAQRGGSRFAITPVDVFDGYQVLRGQTVTVENGMITGLTPAGGQKPAGLTVIDGRGKMLLPGLIDAHCHISGEDSLEQAAALGVTTELDMWDDPKQLLPLKQEVEHGQHPDAADFRMAGVGVTAPKGHPSEMAPADMPVLHPGEDAQAFVDARFREGSDYLKIMYEHQLPTLTEQQLREVVVAAHRRGKMAVAHEGVQFEGLAEMKAGVDGVEHIFNDSAITAEFLDTAKTTHMVFTPTLTVITAASGKPTGAALAKDARIAPYLTDWAPGILNATFPAKAIARGKYEYAQGAVRALHAAGLPILAGTDAPNPSTTYGASVHEELVLLTECGLSPVEALHAATAEPAKQFGLIDRGRIEVGRRADLLLVNGDPTKDVRATFDIVEVWKAGSPIDRPGVAKRMAAAREAAKTRKPGGR